ncbi:MAG: DUF883 family protein [Nitrosomonadaceae bacterium]|nr:DUF883 family protein [Nitrosomonadaceae bacterium]
MSTEMTETHDVAKDKLVADLKVVVADAEELLKVTAGQAGEKVAAAREKISGSLQEAKQQLCKVEDMVVDKTNRAAKITCDYVQVHPWHAVGIAAGVGLILGLLIGRR